MLERINFQQIWGVGVYGMCPAGDCLRICTAAGGQSQVFVRSCALIANTTVLALAGKSVGNIMIAVRISIVYQIQIRDTVRD